MMSTCKLGHTRRARPFLFFVVAMLLGTALPAQSVSFISFDAPDAGTKRDQGTFAVCINANGVVAGYYIDGGRLFHGFVRDANGQVTEFDAPGFMNTYSSAINRNGYVVGYARKNSQTDAPHGFLRTPIGHITVIDPPGSSYTLPLGIDDAGDMMGTYEDSAGTEHGFIRDTRGIFTTFDDPNAGGGRGAGTAALAMNVSHEITGEYIDSNFQPHGFIRDAFGNFTNFDVPGSYATQPTSINSSSAVAGTYDSGASVTHSFLRDAAGNLTTIDIPGPGHTFAGSINDQGTIAGEIINGTTWAGFRRDSAGNFFRVVAPVPHEVTEVSNMNNSGRITGYYTDLSGVAHGFLE